MRKPFFGERVQTDGQFRKEREEEDRIETERQEAHRKKMQMAIDVGKIAGFEVGQVVVIPEPFGTDNPSSDKWEIVGFTTLGYFGAGREVVAVQLNCATPGSEWQLRTVPVQDMCRVNP